MEKAIYVGKKRNQQKKEVVKNHRPLFIQWVGMKQRTTKPNARERKLGVIEGEG